MAETASWGAVLLAMSALFGSRYLGLGMDTRWYAGRRHPDRCVCAEVFCNGGDAVMRRKRRSAYPYALRRRAAGSLFGNIFGLDPSVGSALGLAGVLAGSTNTPIASTILAIGTFWSSDSPFANLVCAVSYVVAGHRSLYPSQVMLRPKTRTFVRRRVGGKTMITGRFRRFIVRQDNSFPPGQDFEQNN